MEFEDVEFMMNWINERIFLLRLREALRELYEKSKQNDMSKKVESFEIVEENLFVSEQIEFNIDPAIDFDLPPLFDDCFGENSVDVSPALSLDLPPSFGDYDDGERVYMSLTKEVHEGADGYACGESEQQLYSSCGLSNARGQREQVQAGHTHYTQQLCEGIELKTALMQQLCAGNEVFGVDSGLCRPWGMKNVNEQRVYTVLGLKDVAMQRVFDDGQQLFAKTQQVTQSISIDLDIGFNQSPLFDAYEDELVCVVHCVKQPVLFKYTQGIDIGIAPTEGAIEANKFLTPRMLINRFASLFVVLVFDPGKMRSSNFFAFNNVHESSISIPAFENVIISKCKVMKSILTACIFEVVYSRAHKSGFTCPNFENFIYLKSRGSPLQRGVRIMHFHWVNNSQFEFKDCQKWMRVVLII